MSFLSPITPTSTLRQSIPASYVTVSVTGTVDVNIYIDLNGQWVSGDRGSPIFWSLDNVVLEDENRALKKWQVTRQTELLLSEIADRAEWGTLHFIGPEVGLVEILQFPATLGLRADLAMLGCPTRGRNFGAAATAFRQNRNSPESCRPQVPCHH